MQKITGKFKRKLRLRWECTKKIFGEKVPISSVCAEDKTISKHA